MKEEIADTKEKLDILMNRLPLEEKILRMEGKIYFFSGSGADSWAAVGAFVMFRVVYKCILLLRG